MRALAAREEYVLLDAAAGWVDAVAEYGENDLFTPDNYNHPNLLGHQVSYWKAIDAFVDEVAAQSDR